jgi:hypothetical protein
MLCTLLGASLLLCFHCRQRVNLEAFILIQDGFTEPQVEELLGGPAGWYADETTRPVGGPLLTRDVFTRAGVVQENGSTLKGWATNRGVIIVTFDVEGQVIDKYLNPAMVSTRKPLFDRVCELFQW